MCGLTTEWDNREKLLMAMVGVGEAMMPSLIEVGRKAFEPKRARARFQAKHLAKYLGLPVATVMELDRVTQYTYASEAMQVVESAYHA